MKRQRSKASLKKKDVEECDLVYPFDHKRSLVQRKASEASLDPVYPFDQEPPAPLPPFVSGGGGISSNGLELSVNTAQPAAIVNDAVTVRYQAPLTTEGTGALGVAVDGSTIVVDREGRLTAPAAAGGGTGSGTDLNFKIVTSSPATIKNNAITVGYSSPLRLSDDGNLTVSVDGETVTVNNAGQLVCTPVGRGEISVTAPITNTNNAIGINVSNPIGVSDNSLNVKVDDTSIGLDAQGRLTVKNAAVGVNPIRVQSGEISLAANAQQLFVANDQLNVNGNADDGSMVFRYGQAIPQFSGISDNPSYRINSLQITNKGTILAFSDYRASANDQSAIEPVLARSVDGGQTWSYIKPVTREGSGVSRLMDPTTLYHPAQNKIWLLLGCWTTGTSNWTQNADTAKAWKYAKLAWSTDDGASWQSKNFPLSDITGAPSDCKGFLGGVGSGIVMADNTLVFPIQWTTGNADVFPSIIYSKDNGATWTWATTSPGKTVLTDLLFASGENMVVEDVPGELLMLSRYQENSGRRAIRTRNLGTTWALDPKYDSKITTGGGCQGSFNLITTKSDTRLLLATAVTGILNGRSGLTLFLFDQYGNPIPMCCINLPVGGGYSTLAYYNGTVGERLLVMYEAANPYAPSTPDPLSQKIKDLTFLIPEMENIMAGNKPAIEDADIDGGKYVFKMGQGINGFYSLTASPFFDTNSVLVTNKGTVLVFSDYCVLNNGNTVSASEPVVARSTDGGVTWTYGVPARRELGNEANPAHSRLLYVTSLYNPSDEKIWVLLGRWVDGQYDWTQGNAGSNKWYGIVMAYSTDDGATWNATVIGKQNIQGLPTDCKGLVGGVGNGIVLYDGTLVFPSQWTKAQADVYPNFIYSENNGSTWKFGGSPSSTTLAFASGENTIAEVGNGSLLMLCRSLKSDISAQPRRAYLSTDMGTTWTNIPSFDIAQGGNCQGTITRICTKSGVTAYLATAVTNLNGNKSGITLYVYQKKGDPVPIYCINEAVSRGGSCLGYAKWSGGEKLVASYAYGTASVKVKDLSWLIPVIEQVACKISETTKTVNVDGGKILFRQGENLAGVTGSIKYPFYRGNSVQITKNGVVLAFADYRSKPTGTCVIQPVLAKSEDGGYNWTYSQIADPPTDDNADSAVVRLMDPTSIYDSRTDKVWLLLGRWTKGTSSWIQSGETANNWTAAALFCSSDEGKNWTSTLLNGSNITNFPSDCKGFLGGVGSGITYQDNTLVFPIQWSKGDGKSYPAVLYSSDLGTTWTWGQGSPGNGHPDLQTGENMVIENPTGTLYMLCRGSTARVSFKSTNLGQTWERDTKYDLPFGANCQGAFVKIVTKTNVTAVLATAVTNQIGGTSSRSGITLFVYPATGEPVPLACINVAISGGYSSIAYLNSPNVGERLIVTYEYQDPSDLVKGNSVKIKDLTYLIPSIEKIATMEFESSRDSSSPSPQAAEDTSAALTEDHEAQEHTED